MTNETFEKFQPLWEYHQESEQIKEILRGARERGASKRDAFGYAVDLITQVYQERRGNDNSLIYFRKKRVKESPKDYSLDIIPFSPLDKDWPSY